MAMNQHGIYFAACFMLQGGLTLEIPEDGATYHLTLAEAKTLRKNLKAQIEVAQSYEESSGNRSG